MSKLKSITIRGFRSIAELEKFELGDLTVLIGANGAGKSNFVEFFRMLRHLADETFQKYAKIAGPENLFFMGPRRTPSLIAGIEFETSVYEFELTATAAGGVVFAYEMARALKAGSGGFRLSEARGESRLREFAVSPLPSAPSVVYHSVSTWTPFHVHDTSLLAPMRGWGSTTNNIRLADDAGNLAAILLKLQNDHSDTYAAIRDTVRLAAPFFDDFVLRPEMRGPQEKVRLEWLQRGSQEPFQPTVLSDGTIRFIALITALLSNPTHLPQS